MRRVFNESDAKSNIDMALYFITDGRLRCNHLCEVTAGYSAFEQISKACTDNKYELHTIDLRNANKDEVVTLLKSLGFAAVGEYANDTTPPRKGLVLIQYITEAVDDASVDVLIDVLRKEKDKKLTNYDLIMTCTTDGVSGAAKLVDTIKPFVKKYRSCYADGGYPAKKHNPDISEALDMLKKKLEEKNIKDDGTKL